MKVCPDPAITVSVYCNRKLDQLLRDAIKPFWHEVRERHPGEPHSIWFFRYAKCGEHLKIRIHGAEAVVATVRERLAPNIESFFRTPAADPLPGVWVSKSALPPLDHEDEEEEDYPNKTLLWTQYRRRPEPVGCEFYTRDETHLSLFARAQSSAAEVVLEHLTALVDSEQFLQRRQTLFLKLMLSGLAATDFDASKWMDYHAYHRDWLIRSLTRINPSSLKPSSILAEFDQRLERARSGVASLSSNVRIGAAAADPSEEAGAIGDWSRSVAAFYRHIQTYRGQLEYDQDPFTDDNAYLPLHKVFCGVANQFGFRLSHEAYLHHLLHAAARTAVSGPD